MTIGAGQNTAKLPATDPVATDRHPTAEEERREILHHRKERFGEPAGPAAG